MANAGSFVKGQKRPNQGKRGPDKTTLDAKRAIAMFVEDNAHRLTGWLDDVANGVKDGDSGKMLVQPNPAKAFEMFQAVIEYHIPKLSRAEHVGDGGGPVVLQISNTDELL